MEEKKSKKEKISKIKYNLQKLYTLTVARKPEKVLILGIIILNFALVFGSAAILVAALPQLKGENFWKTAFNVFTMILDAGCISNIIELKEDSAFLPIFCIIVIFLGTLIFTGAIIGYLSNLISTFINAADRSERKIIISDHLVIINWNNRAAEIINELLFSDEKKYAIILVNQNKDKIDREIKNIIADAIEREKRELAKQADELIDASKLRHSQKKKYIRANLKIKKPVVIVREGEVYSLKQLNDISVSTAKSVIILSKERKNELCKYNNIEALNDFEKGNIDTVKTLVQISHITSSEESADKQKVVVEVEDEWTMSLVQKIIKHKENREKCNIIPIPVNRILGQILSQFSVMPELNSVYSELFSNKGSTFYSKKFEGENEIEYITEYLKHHDQALPITTMNTGDGNELFYIANDNESFDERCSDVPKLLDVKLNENFCFDKKHIAILGHNSKSVDILEGFSAFLSEWGLKCDMLVDIIIIDDEEHLKKVDYYHDYRNRFDFITDVVSAEVYEDEKIEETLNSYIESHPEDTSVLILSDDYAPEEERDSKALTYLVYLQDIIYKRKNDKTVGFNPDSIDVVVELINPKNYYVVKSYSVDNVIISNRYISRMILQIGEKESIYEFYKDILTYDTDIDKKSFKSKEMYIKKASSFFDESTQFPISATPRDLVSSIYFASPDNNKSIALGVAKNNSQKVLFSESKNEIIEINKDDNLILFSPH